MNETFIIDAIPVLGPIFDKVRIVILSLQWLVGGLFGLYLILILMRWVEARAVKKILREISDDIKELANDIRLVNDRVDQLHHKKK
jgi:hypothetical protein